MTSPIALIISLIALIAPIKYLSGNDCSLYLASFLPLGQSIGGFVASMNRNLTRYYSRHTRQHTHMELADGLRVCMVAAIKEWAIVNG